MKDRRTVILDSATRLIAQRGFNGTSVEDVIREARLCGKSHFYHYFPSKEALGFAVLDRHFLRFNEQALGILSDQLQDPLQRLNRYLDAVVELQASHRCKGGIGFGALAAELSDTHEGFRAHIQTVFRRWTEQLQALLWEMRPRMRDDLDSQAMARFIIASLEGGMMLSRVSREICVMEGIVADIKRYVQMQVVDEAGAGSGVLA